MLCSVSSSNHLPGEGMIMATRQAGFVGMGMDYFNLLTLAHLDRDNYDLIERIAFRATFLVRHHFLLSHVFSLTCLESTVCLGKRLKNPVFWQSPSRF